MNQNPDILCHQETSFINQDTGKLLNYNGFKKKTD